MDEYDRQKDSTHFLTIGKSRPIGTVRAHLYFLTVMYIFMFFESIFAFESIKQI